MTAPLWHRCPVCAAVAGESCRLTPAGFARIRASHVRRWLVAARYADRVARAARPAAVWLAQHVPVPKVNAGLRVMQARNRARAAVRVTCARCGRHRIPEGAPPWSRCVPCAKWAPAFVEVPDAR